MSSNQTLEIWTFWVRPHILKLKRTISSAKLLSSNTGMWSDTALGSSLWLKQGKWPSHSGDTKNLSRRNIEGGVWLFDQVKLPPSSGKSIKAWSEINSEKSPIPELILVAPFLSAIPHGKDSQLCTPASSSHKNFLARSLEVHRPLKIPIWNNLPHFEICKTQHTLPLPHHLFQSLFYPIFSSWRHI